MWIATGCSSRRRYAALIPMSLFFAQNRWQESFCDIAEINHKRRGRRKELNLMTIHVADLEMSLWFYHALMGLPMGSRFSAHGTGSDAWQERSAAWSRSATACRRATARVFFGLKTDGLDEAMATLKDQDASLGEIISPGSHVRFAFYPGSGRLHRADFGRSLKRLVWSQTIKITIAVPSWFFVGSLNYIYWGIFRDQCFRKAMKKITQRIAESKELNSAAHPIG